MRFATARIDSVRMTQSTAAIRLVSAPIMNSTMRSGRSMNPTLHFSTSDSARPRGADINQDAGQRQQVWMDAQRHAGADDRAQRKHAERADRARERPAPRWCAARDSCGYNGGFRHELETRHSSVWP